MNFNPVCFISFIQLSWSNNRIKNTLPIFFHRFIIKSAIFVHISNRCSISTRSFWTGKFNVCKGNLKKEGKKILKISKLNTSFERAKASCIFQRNHRSSFRSIFHSFPRQKSTTTFWRFVASFKESFQEENNRRGRRKGRRRLIKAQMERNSSDDPKVNPIFLHRSTQIVSLGKFPFHFRNENFPSKFHQRETLEI